jgi:hypothetical protein
MPKSVAKKTLDNPYGLTYKQQLVIKDTAKRVSEGKRMNLIDSVEKFYDVKNRNTARQVLVNLNQNQNFREALVASLVEKGILGADSKTEGVLLEGLEAETRDGHPDYDVRLRHVQEINKIAGVYAPEKRQTLNLNLEMSEEDLDKHIKELQEQLK